MSKIIGFFILALLLNLNHSSANIFKNDQKMLTENEKIQSPYLKTVLTAL